MEYKKQVNITKNSKEDKLDEFNKIVIDSSNYLFVPESSEKLKYLYAIGKKYTNKKQKYTNTYSEIITEYNHIISVTAKFIKELGLKDNHTSYYIIFTYLLWNGFLSKDMKYIFSNNKLLSLNGFQGLDIINGQGSCRSISNMLNSIFHQLNFESYFLVNSSIINYRDHIIDIERKDKNGILTLPRLKTTLKPKEVNPYGNHASVLLKGNKNYYVYDSTNLSIYKANELLTANLYNGNGQCHIKPWGFIMYENMKQSEILQLLSEIQQQEQTRFMSNKEIKEISNETVEICKKSKILMLDFHNEIKNNINNIHQNIFNS